MFTRIIDGILFFPIAIITIIMIPTITNNRTIERLCRDANYLYVFIAIMVISVGIGIFRKMKGYQPQKSHKSFGKILLALLKGAAVISAFILLLPSVEGDNIALSRIVFLLYIYIFAMLLQAAFLGKRSLMGKALGFLWNLLKRIVIGILEAVFGLDVYIERLIEKIGMRLTTALLQIIVLTVTGIIVVLVHGTGGQINQEYTLSQVIEEYTKNISLYNYDLPAEGFIGELLQIRMGAFAYEIAQMMPIIGMIAGEICYLFGIGLVARITRKIMGWEDGLCSKWDKEHPIYLVIKYSDGTTFKTNHNPHYILLLLLFLIFFGLNGFVGIFLPIFILFNLVVGSIICIIKLIVRICLNKVQNRQE